MQAVAPSPLASQRTARRGAVTAPKAATAEYLAFRLGKEEYAIDILRVQEIRSYENPTRIANAPEHVKGVVNLRGIIVPIIDLRMQLGCGEAQYNAFTVVVVLNVRGHVIGAEVDSVSDVIELGEDVIMPAPSMNDAVRDFITGIACVESRMLILMDIEALLGSAVIGLATAA